ncbi:transcription factor bHLH123 isoform X2 [Lactuca sativa]|uniref:transcription factor bHLH123 isoform X2 n=1 Tax=Lactuca sativa TaxID=4236 RepID=UPI000CAA75E7|nr:transcription factor bHLH123 isoform X2 [Lactuca sativa]
MADKWWDSSLRTATSLDSVSVSNPINVFQDTDTPSTTAMPSLTATATATATSSTATSTTSLHMMGLRRSSPSPPQSLDWNQALLRGDEKSENSFQNLLQDQDHSLRSNTTNFQLESNQWRSDKMYASSSQDSSSDFKQFKARMSHLEQQPMQESDNESIITCQGLNSSFQNMDSYGSPSTMMQNLFGSDSNQQQDSSFDQNHGMNYSMYQSSYDDMNKHVGGVDGGIGEEFAVNSSKKIQLADMGANQLHFSNNTRFWNVVETGVSNIRASFFPSFQMQLPLSTIEDKPKITTGVTKESVTEPLNKRTKNDHQSHLPSFKVKKEKMGDRITALQQLVSPFGKTDTASVLFEAIDYIRFLHEQVSVLSTPYMKNGASTIQHQPQKLQQTSEKSSDGTTHDLRRRGLCLVPFSRTFPVTHETTVDFWTPTFGGSFR